MQSSVSNSCFPVLLASGLLNAGLSRLERARSTVGRRRLGCFSGLQILACTGGRQGKPRFQLCGPLQVVFARQCSSQALPGIFSGKCVGRHRRRWGQVPEEDLVQKWSRNSARWRRSSELKCLNMGLHNSVPASQSWSALIGRWGAHARMTESMLRA
eukprot:981939-Pelagomonas_calceolata.AAC.1